MLKKLLPAWKIISLSKFRFKFSYCPVCACVSPIIRLTDNEIGVRCLRCSSSGITMSIVEVMRQRIPDIHKKYVYEMSSRGSFHLWLKQHAGQLQASEYFEGISSGQIVNGILAQDVQQLSFPDHSFDVCTSTEVFEHVLNDTQGFLEIFRVLRPGGYFIFTVPMDGRAKTLERAVLKHGKIHHLETPEYHLDPIRQHGEILAFRNYGHDITDRLVRAGFNAVKIERPAHIKVWGHVRSVIVARKPV